MIARAEKGQLVDGSGATCAELKKIIEVDRATLELEKAKLNSKIGVAIFTSVDPAQITKVENVEQVVEKQVDRLDKLLQVKVAAAATKGC